MENQFTDPAAACPVDDVAPGAHAAASPGRTQGLRGVVDEAHARAVCDVGQCVDGGRVAEQVGGQDRTRAPRDRRFDAGRVLGEGVGFDVYEYGNGAAIFTRDGDTARDFFTRARIGMIGVNVPIPVPLAYHTFGGWKKSGFGDLNQHGPDAFRFYTRTKTVTVGGQTAMPYLDFEGALPNKPVVAVEIQDRLRLGLTGGKHGGHEIIPEKLTGPHNRDQDHPVNVPQNNEHRFNNHYR